MDNRPIGVFDSGVGGLTAVKELRRLLPEESIVYFGDTARVPYGTKSRETIIKYAMQDIAFLLRHDVKMIIAACGTVSSVLPDSVAARLPVAYTGVIPHAVHSACALSPHGRIGVIGTAAAVRSGSYGKLIRSTRPDAQVFGSACPLFVPLVENGIFEADNPIARLVAEQYLEPIKKEKVDTLILGCTHFPLLYSVINDVLEYQVTLIDPSKETARFAQRFLSENDMLSESGNQASCRYFVTDMPEGFAAVAEKIMGMDLYGAVTQVEIEECPGELAELP